jgi:YaiO family outer membrane protein
VRNRLRTVFFICWVFPLFSYSQDEKIPPAGDTAKAITDSTHTARSTAFKNSLEAGMRYERYFRNYNHRTFLYAQYGRHSTRVDWFIKALRYTLGDLEGYQFESETYWKFTKPGYVYIDLAYSDAVILPTYRFRTELFLASGRVEYSFGLGVVKPVQFKNIPVITGTIGYYAGDYYLYARPTFTYVDNGFTKSLFIQSRRYFTRTDYVALSVLRGADTGTSRDLTSIANSFGNDTYLIRLNGQLKHGRYKWGAGVDYGGIYIPQRSEYAPFLGVDLLISRAF